MLPLAGAILLLIGRGLFPRETARQFALLVSCATLLVSLALANGFMQIPADAGLRSPVHPRVTANYHWLAYDDSTERVAGRPHLEFDC